MTPEEKQAFEAKIHAYVGQEQCPPYPAKDSVNLAMIRHWCEVMGDENPVYTDAAFAKQSSKGGIIAPPAMLQAWILDGYPMAFERGDDAPLDRQKDLHEVFEAHGYTGVLGTNTEITFERDLRPGDELTAHTVIDSISPEKTTGVGTGYFINTVTTFTAQNGEKVGSLLFRVFKFIPSEERKKPAASAPLKAHRLRPAKSHDNKWWWDAVDEGKLTIQRCTGCGKLRHPPRAMCGECHSLEWDSIESKMAGTVHSYVVLHYPEIPGYTYPLVSAVIDLDEGTRIISNVVGCKPEEVRIGMKVQGKIDAMDEEMHLPQFYPAGS